MTSAPQYVVASAFANALQYDAATAAAAIRVPTLYIRAAVPTDLDRFRQLCPQLISGQTVGSGHFHQLEVPDQVNAMIERFLTITVSQQPVRPVEAAIV